MKEQGRGLRVADHLRERLAEIIRSQVRDPRVGMVSVNEVRVSRDFAYADVFVSSLDANDAATRKELITVLGHAAGFLRSTIAKENTMRTTPKLRFHYDEVAVNGARMESLIKSAVAADEDLQRRRGDSD